MATSARGWAPGIGAFAILLPTLQFLVPAGLRPILPALALPLVLLGYHRRDRHGPVFASALEGCMGAVAAHFIIHLVRTTAQNIAAPPEFDVQQFWMHARIAAQGLNVYEPEHSRTLGRAMHASDAMMSEFYFWYPPPTLFLFGPMGWLDLRPAAALWCSAQLGLLAVDIGLLWATFLRSDGAPGFLLALLVAVLWTPTLSTVGYGQTGFLSLLLVLLYWRGRERPQAGVWLALAVFVKPYAALLGLFLLAGRHWRAIVVAAGTAAVVALLSIAVFGPRLCLSYFTMNPMTSHVESATVSDSASLAGLLYRIDDKLLGIRPTNATLLRSPLLAGMGLAMIAATGSVIWKKGSSTSEWALAPLLPMALLVYPVTGAHYATILLVPLLSFWSRRREVPGSAPAVSGILTIAATLFALQRGIFDIAALAFCWLAFLATALLAASPERMREGGQGLSSSPASNGA